MFQLQATCPSSRERVGLSSNTYTIYQNYVVYSKNGKCRIFEL